MGLVYQARGEWDKALEFYQKDLEISEQVGDIHGMAQTFNNMGVVYKARGEWDKALEFYQKSLQTLEQVGDIHGMALTLGNIGILRMNQGRFEEAVKPLEQAIAIFKQIGDERNVQKCQMALDWARAGGKLVDIATLLKRPLDRLLKMFRGRRRDTRR
jgi:tetratricopeptide (TPR) repeat protein